ncbi:MAG: DUF937 domain-containing protein [Novosphingobium sp.]
MDVVDMLRRTGGIDAVAKQTALAPGVATSGTEALAPFVLGGFARLSAEAGGDEAGLGAVVGMLERHGGGGLAVNVLGPDPTDVARGNAVLGDIFGSKAVSRLVADRAALGSGVDPAALEAMLPLLAMLIGGYLAARSEGAGQELLAWLGVMLGRYSDALGEIAVAPQGQVG